MSQFADFNQIWSQGAATGPCRIPVVAATRTRLAGHRRETLWAWLSVVVLVLCWDAATRLDQHVSPPRVRLTHVAEAQERQSQNAFMPVSARPTVN